ncbi:TFIID-18kDa-domain-containing protein [Microthyrium microscopicum]|uniref:Transcription initiation factor TFIID subunit 13 n=1 Tax=Microthyrium microscopicum TaxID=703497 RepID=A0A6A6U359_9PEZI|nr:TFIID-18kDa-domain-containing protein [Microthyrium microscopicum]
MPGMEPRMRPRIPGPQFNTQDLSVFLTGFGDDMNPLPSTIRILDEIATDYVIEMCHEAEMHARYAGRAKIKVDDFNFALRHDSVKLGRSTELLNTDKHLKAQRRQFELPPEALATKKVMDDDAGGKGAGKGGKGRKRARIEVGEDDIDVNGMDDVLSNDGSQKSSNSKRVKSEAGSQVSAT